MKNIFVILCCVHLFSCKVQSQSKTMNKELIEAFKTVKNKVNTNKYGTSIYNKRNEVINFKYIDSTNEVHWTTLTEKDIGLPLTKLKYNISYRDKNILLKRENIIIEHSNPEYKSITNTFVSDALALTEYQEQVSKEIKNGTIITLKIGETAQLKNGVTLTLTNFINKIVFREQPLYSKVELNLILNNTIEKVTFSSQSYNEICYPLDTYTSNKIKGYFFRLRQFEYAESIEILVSKNQLD